MPSASRRGTMHVISITIVQTRKCMSISLRFSIHHPICFQVAIKQSLKTIVTDFEKFWHKFKSFSYYVLCNTQKRYQPLYFDVQTFGYLQRSACLSPEFEKIVCLCLQRIPNKIWSMATTLQYNDKKYIPCKIDLYIARWKFLPVEEMVGWQLIFFCMLMLAFLGVNSFPENSGFVLKALKTIPI